MSGHIEMMRLAERVALQSICKRAQVGAVVVCANGSVKTGFNHNGGASCEGLDARTLTSTVHAEMDATGMQAPFVLWPNVMGFKVLYVTRQPCIDCAQKLTQTGIKTVYYRDPDDKTDGLEHLRANGVQIDSLWISGQISRYVPQDLAAVQRVWGSRNGGAA